MTGPKRNSEFCFPETLNEHKQNLLFPFGPVIKCFVIPPTSKKWSKLQKIFVMFLRRTTWSPASREFSSPYGYSEFWLMTRDTFSSNRENVIELQGITMAFIRSRTIKITGFTQRKDTVQRQLWVGLNSTSSISCILTLLSISFSASLEILGQIKLTHLTNHRQKRRPKLGVSACYVSLS